MEQWICRLVCRMQENDSQAFDELMEFYYPKLLRMAYLISGSHADSEDIVQETFVLCWVNRKKIREPEYFYGWLCRTLTREAWRVCRKAKKEQPAEEIYEAFEEAAEAGNLPLEEVLLQERDRKLYQAVADLPVKQRTAVAAGRVTTSRGSSSRKDDFTSYSQIESVEKELGFDVKAPETFSNGYAFAYGTPGQRQGMDDAGNVVKETGTLILNYHKADMAEISLHVSGSSIYDEETSSYDQTVQYKDCQIGYSCDQYRFVPEGYEISEEEQKQIDEGKLYVSYGSAQVEDRECKYVSWEEDGKPYCFIAFDNPISPEELIQMAREVIDAR